jgi:hypothetical protein
MVCDAVVSDTQVPIYWWNLVFPSSGFEGKKVMTYYQYGRRGVQLVRLRS